MAEDRVMSQEEVLALLQTRGFDSGFATNPVKDAWGRLDSIGGIMKAGDRGTYAVAVFKFSELEVIKADPPYDAPLWDLEIPSSNREKSKMGYWGKSIDKLINAGVDPSLDHSSPSVKNQDYLVGKFIHVVLTPGHLIPFKDQATGKFEDRPTDCYEVVEIRGATPAATPTPAVGASVQPTPTAQTPAGRALELLNGQTADGWHQVAFIDPLIKSDTSLITQIISGEFLAGLIAAGKVTVANGVHTVI